MERTYVGLIMVSIIIICIYYDWINLLYITANILVGYDIWYLKYVHNLSTMIVALFSLSMLSFNYMALQLYYHYACDILTIITIAQLSDVYQYKAGQYFGKHKVGWISTNKTYEGYIYGWVFTVITYYILYITQHLAGYNCMAFGCGMITSIYILGILGGLLSSLFKRLVKIKDYSNVLGPHGGWTDRIDSIIIPMLVYGCNQL